MPLRQFHFQDGMEPASEVRLMTSCSQYPCQLHGEIFFLLPLMPSIPLRFRVEENALRWQRAGRPCDSWLY